jgi:hypothetical protein
MAGRADMKNEENIQEFQRGYHQIGAFFAKHL